MQQQHPGRPPGSMLLSQRAHSWLIGFCNLGYYWLVNLRACSPAPLQASTFSHDWNGKLLPFLKHCFGTGLGLAAALVGVCTGLGLGLAATTGLAPGLGLGLGVGLQVVKPRFLNAVVQQELWLP
jgi:hypothetical protein